MNPSPATVAAARTARLHAHRSQARTSTPHLYMVQSEAGIWYGPYPLPEADGMADFLAERNDFSDMDHALACWCFKG